MIADQWTGRTIDVQAWNEDVANNSMIGPNSTGKIVTGVLKLSQRFTITFLNEPGSIKYDYPGFDTARGTTFMQDLREGRLHTEAEVFSAFALAELQAREQLRAEETADDPDDERYDYAELTSVLLGSGSLTLQVSLYSKAELGSIDVIIPLSVVV